ncbi:uncharacterized protein LOC130783008 [Actinidia eriantha]|uniref:uncharacterized protein LOC130783008 n=1 Tax=Actinidia eriantha TaxID=165200 RepID=UPI0025862AF1|nr:uncharacterized protein LOC130783008 [Actinidia eriantha]
MRRNITDSHRNDFFGKNPIPLSAPSMESPPNPPLRRRNSIATSVIVPSKLTLPANSHHSATFTTTTAAATSSSSSTSSSQSFPAVDFELISIKPLSYTSLKDLLPSSAVQSPTSAGGSGSEISIRNRLVKQAAWAYLQPMSASPDSSTGPHFLRRLWARVSGDFLKCPIANFLRSVTLIVTRALDRVLRAARIRTSR